MQNPQQNYWHLRLEKLQASLEKNNFEVYLAENCEQAQQIFMDTILFETEATRLSWGGSLSFVQSGLYECLKNRQDLDILDTYDKSIAPDEVAQRRRQALLCDLFITGTNAITQDGKLINLDMIGNRIAALTFGPKDVVVISGRNKIVKDVQEGMDRIKNYVAPVNTMRLDKKTPCNKTSYCHDCNSPDRICNTWTITEKSFPAKRVKIILINQDLGF